MKKQRQFTLIEILATIAIITILVGIIVGVRGVADRKALEANTKSIMTKIENVLEQHREDYGWYPVRQTAGELDFSSIETGSGSGTFNDPNGEPYLGEYVTTQTLPGSWDYSTRPRTWVPGGEAEVMGDITDGYGEPFHYRSPGTNNPESYDLWSLGNDGLDGTDDDLTNWER